MAGDWIKVEKATARKPEVLRLSVQLGIHPDHAFGLCVRFWSWCDDNLTSGNAPGVTEALLDALLGQTGFAAALVEVGWLQRRVDSKSTTLVIPHFDRHLTQSAKSRALTARRQASLRSRKSNAASVTKASPEKRREEKNKEDTPPSSPQEPVDDGEAGQENRTLPPVTSDPFAQVFPPPLVGDKLPNYTGSVVEWAWEISRRFAQLNPERRNAETAAKIVKRFADTISQHGRAGYEKLKDYYALADPVKWQAEVDKGTRLPVGTPPLDVCNELFAKGRILSKPQPAPPTAEELAVQREAELKKHPPITAEQREKIKAEREAKRAQEAAA
jgi:hypothetical protein